MYVFWLFGRKWAFWYGGLLWPQFTVISVAWVMILPKRCSTEYTTRCRKTVTVQIYLWSWGIKGVMEACRYREPLLWYPKFNVSSSFSISPAQMISPPAHPTAPPQVPSFDQVQKALIPFHLLYINTQRIRNDRDQVMRCANPIVTTASPFLHASAQSFIEFLADGLLESRLLGNSHLLDFGRFLVGEIWSSDVWWVDDCVKAHSWILPAVEVLEIEKEDMESIPYGGGDYVK